MPKILHTYRYTGRPWEILQSVVPEGYTIKTLNTPTYEQLVKEAEDADYFLVSGRLPIDKGVLDAAKKLKMIQRTGVGTEMLDKEEIKSHLPSAKVGIICGYVNAMLKNVGVYNGISNATARLYLCPPA